MPPDAAAAVSTNRKRFRRSPGQVAAARRFVAEALPRGSDLQETARLLVSETVTSMLDQVAFGLVGTFEVAYTMVDGQLRVEVSDDGGPARLRRRIQARPKQGRGFL